MKRSLLCSAVFLGLFVGKIHADPFLITPDENRESLEGYRVNDYSYLYGMPGFSRELLSQHFKLYEGYVKNTNLLISMLDEIVPNDSEKRAQFGALKRRFGWEYDGMRLHELYFENLGGKGSIDKSSDLYQSIEKQFGSYDNWRDNFTETGLIRGIGWVVLYREPKEGKLFNVWINEHDVSHLVFGTPLLVMDVWEHAYMTDYGIDRSEYIRVFMQNVEWDIVEKRYRESKK